MSMHNLFVNNCYVMLLYSIICLGAMNYAFYHYYTRIRFREGNREIREFHLYDEAIFLLLLINKIVFFWFIFRGL